MIHDRALFRRERLIGAPKRQPTERRGEQKS